GRDTRSKRDWSSDVCSYDLPGAAAASGALGGLGGRCFLSTLPARPVVLGGHTAHESRGAIAALRTSTQRHLALYRTQVRGVPEQIGRASCRGGGLPCALAPT